jgi:hypothetical protein
MRQRPCGSLKIIAQADLCKAECPTQLKLIDNPRAVRENTTPCADRAGDREHGLMSSCRSAGTIQEGANDIREAGEVSDAEIADGAKNAIRQKCESSVRGSNVAQQYVLTTEVHGRTPTRLGQNKARRGDRSLWGSFTTASLRKVQRKAAPFVAPRFGPFRQAPYYAALERLVREVRADALLLAWRRLCGAVRSGCHQRSSAMTIVAAPAPIMSGLRPMASEPHNRMPSDR